jgi:hypothetical protein
MGMGMMGMGAGMGMMGISGSDLLLTADIQRAVILEVQAFNYYQRLIALAATEQQRQIISSIQRDEMMHYHWFTMMLRMMGAQQPIIPPGELPTNYVQGVRTAIRLEQEAQLFIRLLPIGQLPILFGCIRCVPSMMSNVMHFCFRIY